MAYEEANYEVIKENKNYEIRKYPDRLVIETNSIQGNGFRKLFNYISGNNKENKEIKMTPEMLNLLGCSKDNFKKLLQKMNYKVFDKEESTFFKYSPIKKFKKASTIKVSDENPFKVLKDLNLG